MSFSGSLLEVAYSSTVETRDSPHAKRPFVSATNPASGWIDNSFPLRARLALRCHHLDRLGGRKPQSNIGARLTM